MSTKKKKTRAAKRVSPAQVSIFEHKHGVSFGVVPAGVDPAEYWRRTDGHHPAAPDEYVDSYAMPEPYQSAEKMLTLLTWVSRCTQAKVGPCKAYVIGDDIMEQMRALVSQLNPSGKIVHAHLSTEEQG